MKMRWLSVYMMMVIGICDAVWAASDSWNVDAAGSYFDAGNWGGGVVPGKSALNTDSTDVATFDYPISAARTVTLDGGNRNIGGITFGNTGAYGYILDYTSIYSFYLTDGGTIQSLSDTGSNVDTISATIYLLGDATIRNDAGMNTGLKVGALTGRVGSGSTATVILAGTSISGQNQISGVISDGNQGGNVAVIKNGYGMWTFAGQNNTFTGGLTVNFGTVRYYGTGTSLGRGPIDIRDGVIFNHANTSATVITNAMSVEGDFSLTGNTGTLWGGTMDLNEGTRTISVDVDSLFDTVISNGGLIKAGSNTLTLSAASDFSGGTTVSEGSLTAGVDGALGTGNVTNNATLTLLSDSCLDADAFLVLSSGSTLALNYAGTASLSGVSLDGGATYLGPGAYDAAALTSLGSGTYTGSGSISVSGPLTVSLSSINSSSAVFSWEGNAAKSYALQARNDLLQGSWSNVLEDIAGVNGNMSVTSNITADQLFYRVADY